MRRDGSENIALDAPVCDVRLNETEHLLSGLSDLDENSVVDLQQTKKLEDLARFGRNFVDTNSSNFLLVATKKRSIETHPLIRTTK